MQDSENSMELSLDSFCKHQTTEYLTGRLISLWELRRPKYVDKNNGLQNRALNTKLIGMIHSQSIPKWKSS